MVLNDISYFRKTVYKRYHGVNLDLSQVLDTKYTREGINCHARKAYHLLPPIFDKVNENERRMHHIFFKRQKGRFLAPNVTFSIQ